MRSERSINRPVLAEPTMLKVISRSSVTPASTKISASPSFWQVRPVAPAATCMAPIAGILCVLTCGRLRFPAPETIR